MELPIELQYRILEVAEWYQQPVLNNVCSTWRHFLKTSPVAFLNRYSSDIPTRDLSKRDDNNSNPPAYRPRFHRIVTYLTHFAQQHVRSDSPSIPAIHPCNVDFDRSHVTFFAGIGCEPIAEVSLKPPFTLSTLSTNFFAEDCIILPSDASDRSNRFHPHLGYMRFYSKILNRPASGVQLGLSRVKGLNPSVKDYIRSLVLDIHNAHIYFNWPDDFLFASVLKLTPTFSTGDDSQYLVFKLECEDEIPEDTGSLFPSRVLAD
ncbi:hypothetical protein TWF281_004523 [Arthrobotrys megalospora]